MGQKGGGVSHLDVISPIARPCFPLCAALFAPSNFQKEILTPVFLHFVFPGKTDSGNPGVNESFCPGVSVAMLRMQRSGRTQD